MAEPIEEGQVLANFGCKLKNVLKLVRARPVCKGSYLILWCYYMNEYHGVKFPEGFFDRERWHEIPSPETIGRAYRKLKEQGLIEETTQTKINREIAEEDFRLGIGKF